MFCSFFNQSFIVAKSDLILIDVSKYCPKIVNKFRHFLYNKPMKKFIIGTLLLFIALQFIRFDVPATLPTEPDHALKASEEVMSILKRSCYDCHSSHVEYPWYSSVAPFSWITQSHVRKGRTVVNFSTWESYDTEKKIKVLDRLPKAIKIRMPLPSYVWMHKEAELSNKDREILTQWADEQKFELE